MRSVGHIPYWPISAAARSPAAPWSQAAAAAASRGARPKPSSASKIPGEHITAATSSHAGVAGRIYPQHLPVGDNGAIALAQHNASSLSGQLFCRLKAILRQVPTQTSKFPVVGRQDHRTGRLPQYIYMLGQGVYAIGIYHQRGFRFGAESRAPPPSRPRPCPGRALSGRRHSFAGGVIVLPLRSP